MLFDLLSEIKRVILEFQYNTERGKIFTREQIRSEPSSHPGEKLHWKKKRKKGEKDLRAQHLICCPPEIRLCDTHCESMLLWLQTSVGQESDED